jgi:photosystem II stability/assembly factor-like uncharacterized protein
MTKGIITTRVLVAVALLLCAPLAVAQKKKATSATPPADAAQRGKAVWEPVNFPADLDLNDVFFVTDQEGWVTGGKNIWAGGVILHTSDGGDHWDVQVGDPESSERPFGHLRFIDATHGWALQSSSGEQPLLHTTDGTHWLVAGAIPDVIGFADYQFTSDNNGVMVHRGAISITRDGGRTWSPAYKCHAQVEVKGLTQDMGCEFVRLQFLTPQIGYAVGHGGDLVFIARTDDGGQSWNLTTSPVSGQAADAFFIDERTGYLRTGTALLFKTVDGGATWQGLAGSPGQRIKFADPEVGWAFKWPNTVSFTHDGGGRWNSREYQFPTPVTAFSLPRRDRGYVVGSHGMIYRYHAVPIDFAVKGMIEAPRLTPIDFSVPQQLQNLSAQAQSFQVSTNSTTVADAAVPATNIVPDGAVPATNITDPPPAVSPQIETTLNAVVAQAPAFVSRYRNLNLLMVGLQMISGLPQQIADLKKSFALVKTSADANARAAAAADFSTKLQGIMTFMNTNFHSPLLAKKKGI